MNLVIQPSSAAMHKESPELFKVPFGALEKEPSGGLGTKQNTDHVSSPLWKIQFRMTTTVMTVMAVTGI